MDNYGLITIEFNRPLVYEESLVQEYMPDYKQKSIIVKPSQSEIDAYKNSIKLRRLESETEWRRDVDTTKTMKDRIILRLNEGVEDELAELKNFNYTIETMTQTQI